MSILNRKQGQEAAAKMQQLATGEAPLPIVRRPFLEAFQAQRHTVEVQLAAALKQVEDLTLLLQSYRREEMLLSMNPEMDRIFERRSNGKAKGVGA